MIDVAPLPNIVFQKTVDTEVKYQPILIPSLRSAGGGFCRQTVCFLISDKTENYTS